MTHQNPYPPYQQYQSYPLEYGLGPPPKRFGRRLFGWVLFVSLALMLLMLLKSTNGAKYQKIALSDFYSQLLAGNVSQVTIDGNELTGTLVHQRSGSSMSFATEVPEGAASNWAYTQWLLEHSTGATVSVNNQSNILMNILVPLVPWLLIFGFIWFFVFRRLRNASGTQAMMSQVPAGTAPFAAWVYPYQPGRAQAATADSGVSQTGAK